MYEIPQENQTKQLQDFAARIDTSLTGMVKSLAVLIPSKRKIGERENKNLKKRELMLSPMMARNYMFQIPAKE